MKYGFAVAQTHTVRWFRTDNSTGVNTPLEQHGGLSIPRGQAEFLAAEIQGTDAARKVTVYLRNRNRVVGIERAW